jgi:hypothetical protein
LASLGIEAIRVVLEQLEYKMAKAIVKGNSLKEVLFVILCI